MWHLDGFQLELLCFKRKLLLAIFLQALLSCSSIQIESFCYLTPAPQSKYMIVVMYYVQVMLARVSTVKRNNPLILSKNESILEKETKKQEMTMHFLFFECRGIFWKILENSSSFAMDIKAGPFT